MQIDLMRPFVAESVHSEINGRGVKMENDQSHSINPEVLKWADKIIIVADNVGIEDFPKDKVEVWKIKDTSQEDLKGIKKSVDSIDKKIKILVKRVNV